MPARTTTCAQPRRRRLAQRSDARASRRRCCAHNNGSNNNNNGNDAHTTPHTPRTLHVTAYAVCTPIGVLTMCVDDAGAVRLCNWLAAHTHDHVHAALADVYKHYTLHIDVVAADDDGGRRRCDGTSNDAEDKRCSSDTTDARAADGDAHTPPLQTATTTTQTQQQQHDDVVATAVRSVQAYFDAPSCTTAQTLHAMLSRVPVALPPHATPFTTAVWQTLHRSVAAGEVTTYKALGERTVAATTTTTTKTTKTTKVATTKTAKSSSVSAARSHHARAVGRAMASNPIVLLVPCHRVLATSRTLHGYGCGMHRKAWLLRHEHAHDVPAHELQRWQNEQRTFAAARPSTLASSSSSSSLC